MGSPGAEGRILIENKSFSVDSAPAYSTPPNHPGGYWRNLDSSRLAAIFANFESAGHLYLQHFASKMPGYASHQSGPPTFVNRRKMRPASGGVHSQYLPLILPSLRKI
jgi:hypothetical protein